MFKQKGHSNGYIHILKFSKRKNQWQAIQVIKNCQFEQYGHDSFINSIIGLKNYEMASAGANGKIKIWDWQKGCFMKEHQAHQENKNVYFMKYTPEKDTIISGGSDKSIRIWNLKNNSFLEYNFQNPLYSVEFVGKNHLVIGDGQQLLVYDFQQNYQSIIHTNNSRINTIIEINPTCFAIGDTDGEITLFKYNFTINNDNYMDCAYSSENRVDKSIPRAVIETFCIVIF